MAYRRLFIVTLVFFFSFTGMAFNSSQASELIPAYENSVLDSSEQLTENKIYELITGKIKRVNTRQIAESSEFVHGRKLSTTRKVLDSSTTKEIAAHYHNCKVRGISYSNAVGEVVAAVITGQILCLVKQHCSVQSNINIICWLGWSPNKPM